GRSRAALRNTDYAWAIGRGQEAALTGQPAIASIRFHSSSVTGITERRDVRTSGNDANDLSAFTAASVTGDLTFFTGETSMACSFPVLSAGSGYGADAAC